MNISLMWCVFSCHKYDIGTMGLVEDLYISKIAAVDAGDKQGVIQRIVKNYDEKKNYPLIKIRFPLSKTVYPADFRAPKFMWDDLNVRNNWLIIIKVKNTSHAVFVITDKKTWKPDRDLWELIKKETLDNDAEMIIVGFNKNDYSVQAQGVADFKTSRDNVGASIIYRDLPLGLYFNMAHLKNVKMKLIDLSSYDEPKTIIEGINACFNCHSFSADGKRLSLEVKPIINLNNQSIILPFCSMNDFRGGTFKVEKSNTIFWNTKYSPDIKEKLSTIGDVSIPLVTTQFKTISPDGKYNLGTFGIRFEEFHDYKAPYSFFYIYHNGVIGYYRDGHESIALLPGADDQRYIHMHPIWSPDQKYIVYSRSQKSNARIISTAIVSKEVDDLEKTRVEEDGKYGYRYDLYRIPFNDGKGGHPEMIGGASQNGVNNYFPKYSPDGKWIIYCQSNKGLTFLQPDSTLHIIPASGGKSRKLKSNFPGTMNSWHSWSPNGRWLIFASKNARGYTRLFLTHIAEDGSDSSPILLDGLTASDRVVNLPEFVKIKYDDFDAITIPDELKYSDPIQARESCFRCHEKGSKIFTKKVITPERYNKLMEWY